MVDVHLARKANEVLRKLTDGKYHVAVDFIRDSRVFDEVKGRVIYVGCGFELSSLFLFENAEMYVHQDLRDPNLPSALECLAQSGIISDVNVHFEGDFRRETSFKYKSMLKKLIEIHGGESGEPGNHGDIAFNVPDEVKENLGAIYFFGMPYPDSIKCLMINLLPFLKIGGVFEGPYPYADGRFEGAPPSKLGLRYHEGTYVKIKHLTSEEIQRVIGYSIDDYVNRLIELKKLGYKVKIPSKERRKSKIC